MLDQTSPTAARRRRKAPAGTRGRRKRGRADQPPPEQNDDEDDGDDDSTRGKNWTTKETITLVRLKKEQEQRYRDDKMAALTSGNATKRWVELAATLAQETGVPRDGPQVNGKWDRTICHYSEIKDYHAKHTGGGPSYWMMTAEEKKASNAKLPKVFKYEVFEAFDEWMADRAIITPRSIFNSSSARQFGAPTSNSGTPETGEPESNLPDQTEPEASREEHAHLSSKSQPADPSLESQAANPSAGSGAANPSSKTQAGGDGDSVAGSTGKKKGKKTKDTVADALQSSSEMLSKNMKK